MHIELVTDVDQLQGSVDAWDSLADKVSQPRAAGSLVAAWARHMMSPDSELRIWIAREGSDVVAVLPFVAEKMPRGRVRLLPPNTDMIFGAVPIARPDGEGGVVEAVVDAFAECSQSVDLVSILWIPEGSPWTVAFERRLEEPEWVRTAAAHYHSPYTNLSDEGIEAWLAQRDRAFRREIGRRARRCEELGFRRCTTVDRAEILHRLPHLRTFYLSRLEGRGGEGYRFDDTMVAAISDALETSAPGRFRLSVVENDDQVIGASLALRAGTRLSGWLTGYDPEFSRLGPGIATILDALDAGGRAGCELADFGVGDQPYKGDFLDGALPLESATWCRPRLARLLQMGGGQADSEAGGSPSAEPPSAPSVNA
jgi:CelD/BcsL family acetyltransferase involved in cellulose biosynthesis